MASAVSHQEVFVSWYGHTECVYYFVTLQLGSVHDLSVPFCRHLLFQLKKKKKKQFLSPIVKRFTYMNTLFQLYVKLENAWVYCSMLQLTSSCRRSPGTGKWNPDPMLFTITLMPFNPRLPHKKKKNNNWAEPNKNKRNICSSFGQRHASVYCFISSHFQWNEKDDSYLAVFLYGLRRLTTEIWRIAHKNEPESAIRELIFSWYQYILFAL